MLLHFLLFFNPRLVRQSAWNSQCDLEQVAEPFPVEFSEELPLMENAVDRTHLRPQLTNSNVSSEENVNAKVHHGSSLNSSISSELLQDGSCLAEQHPSQLEGNWSTMHISQPHGHLVKDSAGEATLQLSSYKLLMSLSKQATAKLPFSQSS